MDNCDLETALTHCANTANEGYQYATSQYARIREVLNDAMAMISKKKSEVNQASFRMPGISELLSEQLKELGREYNKVWDASERDLEHLRSTVSNFSITLFGRTMAGKSTLMEILTHGNGKSIGNGAQRTTRDVRRYQWNGLTIIDVPGIGAFEGQEDEEKAFHEAQTSDLILFLISDDAPQEKEAECLSKLVALGKPIICLINVKVGISEGQNIRLVQLDVEEQFDMGRLNEIKAQFLAYAQNWGQNWEKIPFVFAHLRSAYLAQHTSDAHNAEILNQISRIDALKKKIVEDVMAQGEIYRYKTFIDVTSKSNIDVVSFIMAHRRNLYEQHQKTCLMIEELQKWKSDFILNGHGRISSFIIELRGDLLSEAAAFSEEHYDDKYAKEKWTLLFKSKNIECKSRELLNNLLEQLNNKLTEYLKRYCMTSYQSFSFQQCAIQGDSIWDIKNWGEWIYVLGGIGMLFSGVVGWSALAVGGLMSLFSSSKEEKIREARKKMQDALSEHINKICDDLSAKLSQSFHNEIVACVDRILAYITDVSCSSFQYIELQNGYVKTMLNQLLELNKNYVSKSCQLLGMDRLVRHIENVARIPGQEMLFVVHDDALEHDDLIQIQVLERKLSESIQTMDICEDNRLLLARIFGNSIDMSKLQTTPLGVTYVSSFNSPMLRRKADMAQQLMGIEIFEQEHVSC